MNQAKWESFLKSHEDISAKVRKSFQFKTHYYRNNNPSEENKYDFFKSVNQSDRLVVYVHGGRWMHEKLSASCFLAEYFLTNNINFVSIGFDLLPTVSMTEMICQVRQAIKSILANHPDQKHVYLMGHSSGAHLSLSALVCNWCDGQSTLSTGEIERLSGAILLSGTYDLRKICVSELNKLLKLSPTEAWQVSPIQFVDNIRWLGKQFSILILVEENDFVDFRDQSRKLYEALKPVVDESCLHFITIDGVDHMSIISEIGDANYGLTDVIMRFVAD